MVFADFEYPFMRSLFANTCILISSTGASLNSQATSGLSFWACSLALADGHLINDDIQNPKSCITGKFIKAQEQWTAGD